VLKKLRRLAGGDSAEHVRRKHLPLLCLIPILGRLLIMMGQQTAPKRCSTTSVWKIKFLKTIGCG
jgi:hypothetical protein